MSPSVGWALSALGPILLVLCCLRESSPPASQPGPIRDQGGRKDVNGDLLPAGALARIGSVRLRHGSEVEGLAFSADGKVLASAGHDSTIRIWVVATGKERGRIDLEGLKPHAGLTNTLATDGKTIAFSDQG